MHEELFSARIKRDSGDVSKIESWFEGHSPFKAGPQHIAVESSLTDDKNVVTCLWAEKISVSVQEDLDSKTFSNIFLRGKSNY